MVDTDFHIKQGDTSPAIKVQLSDENGTAIDITGYQEVSFHMADPDGSTVKVDDDTSGGVSVTDASAGKVKYEWSAGDTDTAGVYQAEWEVTYGDGTIETFPNSGYTRILVVAQLA